LLISRIQITDIIVDISNCDSVTILAPQGPGKPEERRRRREIRGAEGVEWRGEWGGDIPLPSRLGSQGKRRELPQRGPWRSPGRKRFCAF